MDIFLLATGFMLIFFVLLGVSVWTLQKGAESKSVAVGSGIIAINLSVWIGIITAIYS